MLFALCNWEVRERTERTVGQVCAAKRVNFRQFTLALMFVIEQCIHVAAHFLTLTQSAPQVLHHHRKLMMPRHNCTHNIICGACHA